MSATPKIVKLVLEDILKFHAELENSDISPADKGVRNIGLVESAIAAPFQTFGGQDLYPTFFDKAARIIYGLNKNIGRGRQ